MPAAHRVQIERVSVGDEDLGPHEVVVALRYSLLSPGTELARWHGRSVQGVEPSEPAAGAFPFVPGYAAAGVVLSAGDASGFRPGERIFAHVGHQGVVRFDATALICRPVPAGVADRAAPFARLAQVGGAALRLSSARPGDQAVVVGLGLVGILAAGLVRLAGLEVAAVDPSAARRAWARAVGVEAVLAPEEAGVLAGSAALVLECSGRAGAVETAVRLARRWGEVFLVGAPWEREPDVAASGILGTVFEQFLSLRSGWEWQLPRYGPDQRGSLAQVTDWILAAIARGELPTEELVTDVVAPGEVAGAYQALDEDPSAHLGVLVAWGRPEDGSS